MTWSKTWTYFDGSWHEGNPPILGPSSHAFWLGSSVFDGARYYEGVAPDLDLHFARVNRSAVAMHLKALVSVEEWVKLAWEGIAKFDKDTALYIRPMYWPETGSGGVAKVYLVGGVNICPSRLQGIRHSGDGAVAHIAGDGTGNPTGCPGTHRNIFYIVHDKIIAP